MGIFLSTNSQQEQFDPISFAETSEEIVVFQTFYENALWLFKFQKVSYRNWQPPHWTIMRK